MKSNHFAVKIIGALSIVALLCAVLVETAAWAAAAERRKFTTDFRLDECDFRNTGRNTYFSLNPGDFLKLADSKESVEITVLDDTHPVTVPGVGTIVTRVVQEVHRENGNIVETSHNFFARCEQTNDIFYFGETVEPEDVGGAWEAGKDGAVPGIIMPGTFLLGSRYFQEQAPGVALDRAEHTKMGLTITVPTVPQETFEDCVEVVETTRLERGKSIKRYCPGIGVVFDDGLKLVDYSIQQQ
jgi:hypothetical protein